MVNELNEDAAGRHSVTAFFDQREAAEKARADLLQAGYPPGDVAFVPGAAAAASASNAQSGHHQSVLKSLLDIFVFMPSEDQLTYAEGLRRGGMALVVRTGPDGYERAIDILDRDGAVNLDERESSWKREGWTSGSDAPRPGGPGSASQAGFERSNRHDPLVNPDANKDMRERIGVGTSDMTIGSDLNPASAATQPDRPAVAGAGQRTTIVRRDTTHGRSRVRSYIGAPSDMPSGIDPQI